MKNVILVVAMLFAFVGTGIANDGWPSKHGSTRTHKFEVKRGFNYRKLNKKHKKARKHSSCKKIDFH